MNELSQVISSALDNEYRQRAADLHKWVDPLSEDHFWRNPFSYGNSVGHLVLHLTGNLSYYIGARIAETGYIRNRDLEFTESRRPSKVEVLHKFDDTIAMVVATIERQSALRRGFSLCNASLPPRRPDSLFVQGTRGTLKLRSPA